MIALFDTCYFDDKAHTACVLLRHWEDETPAATYTALREGIAAYEPGAFYKRELPCITGALQVINEPLTVIVIDGYVWLDEKPGLGAHLHEALEQKLPVVGVAKTRFRNNARAVELFRGNSKNPLYITSIGANLQEAAQSIQIMKGAYRIPDLLKLCDTLSREI
jgi:deoxyribonuclease V